MTYSQTLIQKDFKRAQQSRSYISFYHWGTEYVASLEARNANPNDIIFALDTLEAMWKL